MSLLTAGWICLTLSGAAAAQESPSGLEEPGALDTRWARVKAGLTTEVWHDDNLLLASDDEVDDVVTVLSPEVQVLLGREERTLDVRYRGRDRLYNERDEFNGMEHFVDARGRYGTEPVRVEAWDAYQGRNDAFSLPGVTTRIDWLQNDAGGTVALGVRGFSLELSGEFRRVELFDDAFNFFDHRRWQGSALAALDIAQGLALLAEGGVGASAYDDEGILDDFEFRWLVAGWRGRPLADVEVLIKIGGFRVEVDQGVGATVSDDGDGLQAAAAIRWDLSERGYILTEFERRPLESIYSGWAILQRTRAEYAHAISDEVTMTLGGFHETARESEGGEDREAYGGSVRLTYRFNDRLAASVGWELRAKDSDDGTFDYDNRRTYAGVEVTW